MKVDNNDNIVENNKMMIIIYCEAYKIHTRKMYKNKSIKDQEGRN